MAPEQESTQPEGTEESRAREDGVDRTLVRWMLSLTPAERLDALQKHVEAVEASRGYVS
jgi:hypothetical protein